MSNNTQIEMVKFEWKTNSFTEKVKYVFSLIFSKLACLLLNKHTWLIMINDWDYSSIGSLEEFRRYCASNLKCRHCGKIHNRQDVELTDYEVVCYNWETKVWWNYCYVK